MTIDNRLFGNILPSFSKTADVEGVKSFLDKLLVYLDKDSTKREAETPFISSTMTYASTLSYTSQLGRVVYIETVNAVGNATINASMLLPGPIWFVIKNDATSNKTITFGANLLDSGNLVGTTNKVATVHFVSDGTTAWEVARTTGL